MLGCVAYADNTTNTNVEVKTNTKEQILQSIKNTREGFKTELNTIREQAKLKIDEMKTNFKASLKNIKDENKKTSAEKIVSIIQDLNTKTTDNLSNKTDKIENVLIGIESRISKAQINGLDVSLVNIEVEKSKTAIAQARSAISAQALKVYTVNITSEATLKSDMKTLRDTFKKDLKDLNAVVKLAHESVKNTATTLAKIPKIDEAVTTKVEDNKTTNNN
jgi:hypothetical protein